jgi:hypothetical protein
MNNSVEYLRRHSGGHFRLVPPLANGKTPLRRRPVISYHLSRQFIPRLTCNCELSWSRHAIAASVLGGGVSSANSPLLAPLIVTDNSLPRNKFLPIAEILSGPSRGGWRVWVEEEREKREMSTWDWWENGEVYIFKSLRERRTSPAVALFIS